jgi:hypothetical protein
MPFTGDQACGQFEMACAAANEVGGGDPVLGRVAEPRYTILADADYGEPRR